MSPELSVVVPVHNEIDNLAELVAEIRGALDGRVDYEVIYVDDGSDDGTAGRLSVLASEFSRLRIVRHRQRAGQSAAIVSGVRAARGGWVATLDGDGQNDPADILPLLAAIRDPAAPPALRLVIGERRRRRDRWDKRVAGRIANTVRAGVLGDATPDTGCGIKLFSRDAFLAVPQFDHMHRFLPALFLHSGWQVASVPVSHRPRRYGRSHYGVVDRLWVGIVDLAGVLWLQRRPIHATIVEEPDGR
ncbi:MAG TPA: glycosyltransferase family 2 protein [Gemmatimonadales bacterium]